MIIKRVGGKSKIVDWLKCYFPPCKIFVDVFGGSGVVCDAMRHSKCRLIFNDLDQKVYTFFRVLQTKGTDLSHLVNLTPYSRDYFQYAFEIYSDNAKFEQLSDIDKALIFLIVNRQSFGAKMTDTWSITREGEVNYDTWNLLPKYIVKCHEQWKHVFLENLDYRELLKKWDSESTLHYLDPPYEGVEKDYYEINSEKGFDHNEMLTVLQAVLGSYCVSYYGGEDESSDSELVEKYKSVGCKVYRNKVAKHLSGANKKSYAIEVLIVKQNRWASKRSGVFD